MGDVRQALDDDHPLAMLAVASSLLAVIDPRNRNPFEFAGPQPERLGRDDFIGTLLDVDQRETTALLAAYAGMSLDELMATRIRRELANRDHQLPPWLARIDDAEVTRAVEMVHILGDGDNVMVGLRLATGQEMAIVVYIDHNLGTVVKDAFVVPESIDGLVMFMRKAAQGDPDTAWNDIDGADARARITSAIETGAMTVPRFETDTWPACRPLVEWVTALLPAGGHGYERPEWTDEARQALAARFLATPFAADLDEDHADLLDDLLWFGVDYGPGDPLRWSQTAVELVLLDWIPRKIVAPSAFLSKAPAVLRAFIRFAHAERGIRPSLTDETLAAVDDYEPEYQNAIRSSRPQGPAALLAAMGVIDPDGPWVMPGDEPPDYRAVMVDVLRRAVGGAAALAALDDAPLPDEDFSWEGIDPVAADALRPILAECDRCCDELLDVEYRTACRRFLRIVALGEPETLKRGRPVTAAAAACWIVGKANDLFTPSGGRMLVKDLMASFGIQQGGVSQRATTMLRAGGFSTDHYQGIEFGRPDLLVSARRRSILQRRDRYQAMLEGRF